LFFPVAPLERGAVRDRQSLENLPGLLLGARGVNQIVETGRDRRPCARHVVLVGKWVGLAKLRTIDVLNLVPRNAEQPSDDRRLSGEGADVLECHEKDVLDDVL